MTRSRLVPAFFLSLVTVGCGGSPPSVPARRAGAGPGAATAPARGPVIRWEYAEDGPAGVRREWADSGGWRADLAAIRAGDAGAGARLRDALAELDDPVRRPEVLRGLLDEVADSPAPGVGGVLRAFPADLTEVVLAIGREDPPRALDLAARYLFVGRRPVKAAWDHPELRALVAAACERSGDPARDIETGPRRALALRLAKRARVREALPAIKKAAGRFKTPEGRRVVEDPYTPAAVFARSMIRRRGRGGARGR